MVKKAAAPLAGLDGLFVAGTSGRLLMRSPDRLLLFDQQARKTITELQVAQVKSVVWNSDYSLVALLSKRQLIICNKNLDQLCVVNETVRLKGGCWDQSVTKPLFVYTTLNHVKYVLPNGYRGILRCLDTPVYAAKLQGQTLFCLDREGKMKTIEIDVTEALFKLALEKKDYGEVHIPSISLYTLYTLTYPLYPYKPSIPIYTPSPPSPPYSLA